MVAVRVIVGDDEEIMISPAGLDFGRTCKIHVKKV